jgi:hypothetical protein
MVQRFKPEPYLHYEQYGWDSEHPSAEVRMVHSTIGEWVKIETYRDVVAAKDAEIARLKKKLQEATNIF